MKFKNLVTAALLASSVALSLNVHASVVTSNAGFNIVEDFESFDGLVTKGPQALSNGLSVQSDIYSTIGAFAVDLVNNGTWGAGNNFAGIGDLSFLPTTDEGFLGSITFNFDSNQTGVGALFSIFKDDSTTGEITIEALDASQNVLETTTFSVDFNDPFLTNAGLFYGFTSNSANIASLRVSGDGFVVDNISTQAVPVPGALIFMLSGIVGLFARRRSISA